MKELIKKLEDKIGELKERKDKIKYKLDVIDGTMDSTMEDEKENAQIISDMLTGEINGEELEDKLNDLDDDIHSLMDIVETLKLGKELDQMQEAALKELMYIYDITA